jgi:hypothetical protein
MMIHPQKQYRPDRPDEELEAMAVPRPPIKTKERIKRELFSFNGSRPGFESAKADMLRVSINKEKPVTGKKADYFLTRISQCKKVLRKNRLGGSREIDCFLIDAPLTAIAGRITPGTELEFSYGSVRTLTTRLFSFVSRVEDISINQATSESGAAGQSYLLDFPSRINIKSLRKSFILEIDRDLAGHPRFSKKPLRASVVIITDENLGAALKIQGRLDCERRNEFPLIDISVDALRIFSERKMREGGYHDLKVFLPGEDDPVHLKAASTVYSDIPASIDGIRGVFSVLDYRSGRNSKASLRIKAFIDSVMGFED